ncbi:MAG: PDZ domain-containing protein [Chitinophagales bacterium]|nr:PDZ domain-containing protein [Chitinophagales bacterium]
MKTFLTYCILACGILVLTPLAAQVSGNTTSGKTITITKKTTEPDGTERTEILVKKGQAAENFSTDQYIRENRGENVSIEIREESGNGSNNSYNGNWNINIDRNEWREIQEDIQEEVRDALQELNIKGIQMDDEDENAFLGVEPDSDESDEEPGVLVDIIRNSAAEKAGLRSNDLILSLNGRELSNWDELVQIIENARPGDKMPITYSRNGKTINTEVTLSTRNETYNNQACRPQGFLGVNQVSDDPQQPGIRVTIVPNSGAARAGLQDNDVLLSLDETPLEDFEDLSDYIKGTSPGDTVLIRYQRKGKTAETTAILGAQKGWDWESWGQNINTAVNDVVNFKVQAKSACLGVYTEPFNLDRETSGAKITGFTEKSPAENAGLAVSDVIVAVNDVPVRGHSELWTEISKYAPGQSINIAYRRQNQRKNVEVKLNRCDNDDSSVVEMESTDPEGDNSSRRFFISDWHNADESQLRQNRVITIRKGDGDVPKLENRPERLPENDPRYLRLRSFRAYPNPTPAEVTVEFSSDATPTIISLYDGQGRQLFREELNAFDGHYRQQFDLGAYSNSNIIVQIVQGEKMFTEQVVVN